MRLQAFLAIAAAALLATASTPAAASDHYDGPAVLDDATTDITDMYVFPSPGQPGRLVLVMNIYPNAGSSRWFTHGLEYRFRLRPVSVAGKGADAGFKAGADEIVFSCKFKHSGKKLADVTRQEGHCHTPQGTVTLAVNQPTAERDYQQTGIRAFAGLRLDPFFMDVEGIIRSMKAGKLDFTGKNLADKKNVLSIILEIDSARFLPDPRGMYGVVSEIRTRGHKPVVLDTFGRPEVTNVILSDPSFDKVNRTIDVRDLFNRYDPFGKPGAYAGPFRDRLNANLHRLDTLDGRIDWPLKDGVHPLSALQLADFTVIDLSKPVGNGSWFEIERAVVEGRQHQTGGGRWLNDDICDIQYTYLIARDREKISDGVHQATEPAAKTFPYLRDPLNTNQR